MKLVNFYKTIAERIKYYRAVKSLTQEQLAEIAGISTDYPGKIETCINKPGIKAIVKIINGLDVSISEFFKTFNWFLTTIYPVKVIKVL